MDPIVDVLFLVYIYVIGRRKLKAGKEIKDIDTVKDLEPFVFNEQKVKDVKELVKMEKKNYKRK